MLTFLLFACFSAFVVAAYIYGYLCDEGYLYPRRMESVKLTCRTLNPKVAKKRTSGNRFGREWDSLFLYITDIVDFAACKYIEKDALPVLVQQEYNHAAMHRVNKEKYVLRFEPIRILFDTLALRCGPVIGRGILCAVEIGTSIYAYYMINQKWIPNVFSDAALFHFLEEVEHSCLTAAYLRPLIAWPLRIALTPLACVMIAGYSFAPTFTYICSHPKELFTDLSLYHELGLYLIVHVWAWLAYCLEILLHFAPPSNFQGETVAKRAMIMGLMEDTIKVAGFELVEGISASYDVMM